MPGNPRDMRAAEQKVFGAWVPAPFAVEPGFLQRLVRNEPFLRHLRRGTGANSFGALEHRRLAGFQHMFRPFVEKPRFSAGVRAGASGAVGRDAQDTATSGLRAIFQYRTAAQRLSLTR
jgi:hypothetical protein